MRNKNFWLAALWTGCAVVAAGTVAVKSTKHPYARHTDAAAPHAVARPAASPASPATVAPLRVASAKAKARAKTRVARHGAPKATQLREAEAAEGLGHESLREKFRSEMSSTSRGGTENEADPDAFARWFYAQRSYPTGTIPSDARYNALQSAIAVNGGLRGAPGDPTPPGTPPAQATWVSIGPSRLPEGQTDTSAGPALSPVVGRVSAIAVHPSNPNIVYTAGAQGGVWKTTNALSSNPSWNPMTDHQPSLAIGDIAIDPVNPNIVYAGTGEGNGACDSYYGKGILRSQDGGVNWTVLGGLPGGPFDNMAVSKILIDPATAGSVTGTTLWASTVLGFLNSGTNACGVAPAPWNGAVWRSTDSGATWALQDVPTGAVAPNARIHDMVLDPTDSNILYVAVRSVPTAARGGVWKSTNAKASPATFTKVAGGYPDAALANPGYRRITLATGGAAAHNTLFSSMEAAQGGSPLWGLYKSVDGGATWAHVDNGQNGLASITSGSRVVTRVSGTPFSETMIGHRVIVNNQFSRTVASVADPDHLTVRTADAAFNVTNASVTFSISAYPLFSDGQSFYDMTISIDPTDAAAATVYVGGNPNSFNQDLSPCPFGTGRCRHSVWRSDDGGLTWRGISQGDGTSGGLHPDDHEIYLDPSTTPARVYDGNDGGIWRSENKGNAWTALNTNIAITQFQGVATHPSNPNVVIGGTQDNGTNILNPAFTPAPAWFHTDFGDGGQASIDQATPSRMFHTYFNAQFSFMGPAKSTTGGNNGPGGWDFVGAYYGAGGAYNNGMNPTDPVSFYAPLALHSAILPKNPVYFGSNKLYRAPDPQKPCCETVNTVGCGFPAVVCTIPPSWTAVSPVLTKGGAAVLSAIGVYPNLIAGKEVVYTGASDGRIESSSNIDGSGVATWTVLDTAGSPLPNRFVTWIEAASSDPTGNTAYATFSGFNVNTPTKPGHVYRTVNGLGGAATWTDLSGDLPDIPTNAIAVDPTRTPNVLYVGTDIGVFQSLDDGAHWAYLSQGHPVVSVFGLSRNRTTGQIVSATHGRGMFQLSSDGLADTTSPVCGGSSSGNNTFNGTALDAGANDTGVASITLGPGSTNLVLKNVSYSGAGSATFTVSTINHCRAGSGNVVVRDYAGNTCVVAVSLPGDVCADFSADSQPDLIWRRDTGENTVWIMSGTTLVTTQALPSVTDPNWQIGAAADFTLDGKVDLLWRNGATGENLVWQMNGVTRVSQVALPSVTDVNWQIRSAADFNGDGKPDIVWRNVSTGADVVWIMNGTTLTSVLNLPPVFDLNWQIAGSADFNSDGSPDLLWRNLATGENVIWNMNGTSVLSYAYLQTVSDLNWKLGAVADLSGDGQPDLVWHNVSTGQNVVWVMSGTSIGSQVPLPPVADPAWKLVGPR